MPQSEEFAEFVRVESRSLLRTAWLLCGDWGMAEDLVQTALAKTWPRWETIDPTAAVRQAYVRRVLANTYFGWRKRRWTAETVTAHLPEAPVGNDEFAASDLRGALIEHLRHLPARQRAVIVLRYFDDLTEAATAEALGCSIGTVKTHASRALATLRTIPGLDHVTARERP